MFELIVGFAGGLTDNDNICDELQPMGSETVTV
jgi:hypothetical protein